MQLDAVTAELRPRNAWEATDLGMAMVQHWCGPIYRTWLMVTLPLFVLLHLLCWGHWGWVPWLLWWLKPLLDRPILYVLSHALFGDVPTAGRVWRALPNLLRHRALPALTLWRLDIARSFHLPVSQLESLRGRAYRQRLRDLGHPGRGPAAWLTVVGSHLEIALDFALVMLVWMLIPDFVDLEWFELLEVTEDSWGQLWLNLLTFCGMSLVEPFYVAAGFALYLNRRTWLEAWDLELGFRRLAARLAPNSAAVLLTLSLALGGVGLTAWPSPSLAETPTANDDPHLALCAQQRQRIAELNAAEDPVRRALAETLNEPELQGCQIKTGWRWREQDESTPPPEQPADSILGRWFAAVTEYALWAALGLAAVMIAGYLWRQRKLGWSRIGLRRTVSSPPPASTVGQNPLTRSPDTDLGRIAWRLWRTGHPREAIRALYRGSLAGLVTRYHLPVATSATEEECLRLAARLNDVELLSFFQRLTRVWQGIAYADRPPDEASAHALCQEWPRHFALPHHPASASPP